MLLSVIIPCYNEEHTMASVLDAVLAVDVPMEIIAVDDGSVDQTAEIVDGYSRKDERVKLVRMPQNQGKGSAIREALKHVSGDIAIIQDADLEYDPEFYPQIIGPIADGHARVVYGSRFRGSIKGMRLPNLIANRILTHTANLLYKSHLTDEATCYKAFDAELLKSLSLKCTGFEFCPEVTAKVRRRGVKIVEVPVDYVARSVAQGKKIKWTDAFTAVWTLVKYRFVD